MELHTVFRTQLLKNCPLPCRPPCLVEISERSWLGYSSMEEKNVVWQLRDGRMSQNTEVHKFLEAEQYWDPGSQGNPWVGGRV